MANPQVSRFACLKIEDDEDDTREEKAQGTSQNNRQAASAKSKKGKKKKKQSDSGVTNEAVHKECPICMELLDRDGRRFFPCPCRYQVCGFCWHRILNEGDSRCPSCRSVYARSPCKPNPQLRNLAFGLKSGAKPKPAPAAAATAPAQAPPIGSGDTTTHGPNVTALPIGGGGGGAHVSSTHTRNGEAAHQWEEWKLKDAQFTDHTFEDDLQKAIMMSKLEYEQQRLFYDDPALKAALEEDKGPNRKERRKHLQGKDKPVTMSLDQFQAVADAEEDLRTVVPQAVVQRTEPEVKEHKSKKKKSPAAEEDGKFFDKVEQDTKKLLNIERRKEELRMSSKSSDHGGGAGIRVAEMQVELEAKDLEMAELKEEMTKLKSDHLQVKKRNKQLLVILAQGEMKDKAEVLQQVDDLSQIRDELTQEVAELHAALEQERSKVSTLKAELLKYQKHGK
ncbi:G kinase-anchoring protein 1-like isoform X1 [Branchiostoma floridae x Branchiostoma belcheri]